jgi:hypothetical protein
MKQHDHLVEVRSAQMIDDGDATQIEPFVLSCCADSLFVANHGYSGDTSLSAISRSDDGSSIVSFRQDDVLWS